MPGLFPAFRIQYVMVTENDNLTLKTRTDLNLVAEVLLYQEKYRQRSCPFHPLKVLMSIR